jgi:hypothetical protein
MTEPSATQNPADAIAARVATLPPTSWSSKLSQSPGLSSMPGMTTVASRGLAILPSPFRGWVWGH